MSNESISNEDTSEDSEGTEKYSNDQKRMREKLQSDLSIPRVPSWDNAETMNYNVSIDKETGEAENIVDYANLEDVNTTINSVRVALFRITKGLDNTERELKVARTRYEREFRREYLTSTEKTETRKKEFASLMTENFEDQVVFLEVKRTELQRRATLLRDELSIMNTLSNNIRQQIKG